MPDQLWALLSVAFGVMLTMFVDDRKRRRDELNADRKELRGNLREFTDDILAMREARRELITEATLHSHTKANVYTYDAAATKVAVQVIRFGDRALDDAVAAWVAEVNRQTYATTSSHALSTAEEQAHEKALFAEVLRHTSRLHETSYGRSGWLSRNKRSDRCSK